MPLTWSYMFNSCAKKASEKFHRIAVKKPILYGMGHSGHFSKPRQEGSLWFRCSASWAFFWISPDTSHSPGSGCRRLSMRLSKPYWDIMRSCHQYSVCSCRLHPSHYHANVANKASIASYLIRFWKAKVKVTCECCQAMTQGTLGTFDDIPYHVSTWGLQDGASQWFRMFCSTPPDVCWLFAVLSRNLLLRLHAKGLGSLTDGKLLQCMENCATSMIDVGLQFGKESEINRINTEKCNWKDQKKQQQEHTGAIESRFTVWPPFPCSLQKHSF